MQIVQKQLKDIVEYVNNPRNNEAAVDKVAASIKEFGFKQPIVIDKDNVIVAGHTRYKAARKLKLKTVPCVIADDLTDAQIKAYRIADNKVSEYAEWNDDLLALEFEGLQELDFDLELTGFDLGDIDGLTAEPEVKEPKDLSDEVKEVYEVIVECQNETEQESVFYNLTNEGYKCRVLTL